MNLNKFPYVAIDCNQLQPGNIYKLNIHSG